MSIYVKLGILNRNRFETLTVWSHGRWANIDQTFCVKAYQCWSARLNVIFREFYLPDPLRHSGHVKRLVPFPSRLPPVFFFRYLSHSIRLGLRTQEWPVIRVGYIEWERERERKKVTMFFPLYDPNNSGHS